MKKRILLLVSFCNFYYGHLFTQVSGLDKQSFSKYWKVEAETSFPFSLKYLGDTLEITTRGGCTLWRKEKILGDVEISYSACVLDQGRGSDRLSDLNCFWMAQDPLYPESIFKREPWRNGIFERYYSLRMYYLGYGGNNNTTTRFRRYDGNWNDFQQHNIRPVIIQEYTDAAHLLKANTWYHIRIICRNGHIQYYINNELLVDFTDPQPLHWGWFAFRTTWSRVRITQFQLKQL